ncbi:protein phosphatase CheZ [Roseomonas sp. NAR14]|uniref:Protein phosphatase CheZ n=1 Tax=Roseomonas acroporae TaxID=2937791 RepID=A0A9X1YBT7_9PROT|nr:protein phosphatase CheZ [Roseomonas acroporae]MCK8786862.1 protein phosphatase CheZ [Roseomonas acroporae]
MSTPEDGVQAARIEAVVRTVLASLDGDLTSKEMVMLGELEELGRTIRRAKSEIAALRVDDIKDSHIPNATDELDAIVAHTAAATNEILDCCEVLEVMQPRVGETEAELLRQVTTRVYEACSFQDITGQRIAKVVSALHAIERRVSLVLETFAADGGRLADEMAPADAVLPVVLENGPQLPGVAMPQAEIDRLLASFD